jgi:hypothetical protein
MDRNPIKGGVSFTEYTFILGVELRSVCFDGVGVTMTVTDLSKGLVETGTTRSRGILILRKKIPLGFSFLKLESEPLI